MDEEKIFEQESIDMNEQQKDEQMNKTPDTIKFHREFVDSIGYMDNEAQLELYWAIINYGFYGKMPETDNRMVNMVFGLMKKQMDSDKTVRHVTRTVRSKTQNQNQKKKSTSKE